MMGKTGNIGFHTSWELPLRTLRLAAVALGITLVVAAGAARAGDDDEEEPQESFEQGFFRKAIQGLGGQTMEDSKIEYRERSPLVVPSKIDLPPPASGKPKLSTNWPKDPTEQARRDAIAAAKEGPADPIQATRPLMPSELAARPKAKPRQAEGVVPGAQTYTNQILMPSELGSKGNLFSNMFGGQKEEKAVFKEEPKREALTQPPSGYQTPSPNYAYGTGPAKGETKDTYNPLTDKGVR